MDYTQKQESGFCLENATMIQLQDMFENGKSDIVLKTVKSFNINRTPFIILIPKNILKLGFVVLFMLNKMLVIVFFRLLLSIWAGILKTQSINLCPFLTFSVRNGPSVSFGTNIPCIWAFKWDNKICLFLKAL